MTPPPASRQSGRTIAAVGTLLGMFAAACLAFAFTTSPTFDEPFFVHAGYNNLKAGAPKVATANLILAQNWMALPLQVVNPRSPTAKELMTLPEREREPSRQFVFHPDNNWRTIIRSARAMNILVGAALGLVVFFWARTLFGSPAALVALAFHCLSPVMISNSALATTDIMTALWFAVAVNRWWALLHRVSLPNVAACGLATGLLFVTKISSVLLVPMVLLMAVVRLSLRRPLAIGLPGRADMERLAFRDQLVWLLGAAGVAATAGMAVMWLCYLPQMTIFAATDGPMVAWDQFTNRFGGLLSSVATALQRIHLLPTPYLEDLRLFDATTVSRRGYLLGEYALGGWWYFFPVAWWCKTPIPFIIALAGAAAGIFRREILSFLRPARGETVAARTGLFDRYQLVPLLVLVVVYLGVSVLSGLNIGIRHLLPIFGPLFIIAGAGVFSAWHFRPGRIAITLLLLWSAREAWQVSPQFLAYFNQFAGGPEEGHRVLIDSSYEWGQDLPAVENWLAARAARPGAKPPVYFSYFGNADLRRFKIDATMLPQFFDTRTSADTALRPGTYIVSATMLHALYGPLVGPWRPSYEALYQALLPEINALGKNPSTVAATAERDERIRFLDQLRFARLCAYLRQRSPDARPAYGMLVFELNEADLARALLAPPVELRTNYQVAGTERLPQNGMDFQK